MACAESLIECIDLPSVVTRSPTTIIKNVIIYQRLVISMIRARDELLMISKEDKRVLPNHANFTSMPFITFNDECKFTKLNYEDELKNAFHQCNKLNGTLIHVKFNAFHNLLIEKKRVMNIIIDNIQYGRKLTDDRVILIGTIILFRSKKSLKSDITKAINISNKRLPRLYHNYCTKLDNLYLSINIPSRYSNFDIYDVTESIMPISSFKLEFNQLLQIRLEIKKLLA